MERSTLSTPNTTNLRPERLAARLVQKKSAASGEQTCFVRIVVLLISIAGGSSALPLGPLRSLFQYDNLFENWSIGHG